jgi:phospholipase C
MIVSEAPAASPNFQHIVVIFQENRTPDNLFYGLCGAPFGNAGSCSTTPSAGQYNIQTSNWLNSQSSSGTTQPGSVPLANAYDLNHSHSAFVAQCDVNSNGLCQMDGSAAVSGTGACPDSPQFRFVDNSSGMLNPYLELATQYGWANYMFQTNQGPSFPAHQYIFGGTSAPTSDADRKGVHASENPLGTAGLSDSKNPAGCTADALTRVMAAAIGRILP